MNLYTEILNLTTAATNTEHAIAESIAIGTKVKSDCEIISNLLNPKLTVIQEHADLQTSYNYGGPLSKGE